MIPEELLPGTLPGTETPGNLAEDDICPACGGTCYEGASDEPCRLCYGEGYLIT